jgi:hypothetical protein
MIMGHAVYSVTDVYHYEKRLILTVICALYKEENYNNNVDNEKKKASRSSAISYHHLYLADVGKFVYTKKSLAFVIS